MVQGLKRLYYWITAVLACTLYGFPARKLIVIGVTGTDGKTTTTTLIYKILRKCGKRVSMISTIQAVIAGRSYDTGFHVTTPSAFHIQRYLRDAVIHGDTHVVLEVTSHALDQYRVWGISFAIGTLTNVTHEHLDYHKTFQSYVQTKITLLKESKTIVINRDQKDIFTHIQQQCKGKRIVTFGLTRSSQIHPYSCPFHTKLPGQFNRYNCLAALAVSSCLKLPEATVQKAISEFQGVSGRMEYIIRDPFSVIVDFAHTPCALENMLQTIRPLAKKRLIHVFGCAGLRDKAKRPLMGSVSGKYSDIIVLTEEDYRTEHVEDIMNAVAPGISENKKVYRFPNRTDAIQFALSISRKGDVVAVTGKGHEKSLCRGTVEYPWSDQKEIRKILKRLHLHI